MNGWSLLVPLLLLGVLIFWSWREGGPAKTGQGFREAGTLFAGVLPNLVVGFSLAGLMTVMLPRELVAGWLGGESGFKGLAIGSIAGALTPGGPFTHFPILASLVDKGAAAGPVSAYIAGWSLVGVHRLMIWEAPILGWRFATVRFAASFLFPVLIGFVTTRLDRVFRTPA